VLKTRASIARSTITAALTAAGADDLAAHVHALRLSYFDGGDGIQASLALTAEMVTDLAVFLVALTHALPMSVAGALAEATRQDGPVVYWPGWVLTDDQGIPELTAWQAADAARDLADLDAQLDAEPELVGATS